MGLDGVKDRNKEKEESQMKMSVCPQTYRGPSNSIKWTLCAEGLKAFKQTEERDSSKEGWTQYLDEHTNRSQ